MQIMIDASEDTATRLQDAKDKVTEHKERARLLQEQLDTKLSEGMASLAPSQEQQDELNDLVAAASISRPVAVPSPSTMALTPRSLETHTKCKHNKNFDTTKLGTKVHCPKGYVDSSYIPCNKSTNMKAICKLKEFKTECLKKDNSNGKNAPLGSRAICPEGFVVGGKEDKCGNNTAGHRRIICVPESSFM
jgi:hypothetical protein